MLLFRLYLHIYSMEKHAYAKGTVEICIFCEYALQRLIYVCIEEYIQVPIKEVDDQNKTTYPLGRYSKSSLKSYINHQVHVVFLKLT